MGSEMASNLVKAGYKLVVNDVSPAVTKAQEEMGAQVNGVDGQEITGIAYEVFSLMNGQEKTDR